MEITEDNGFNITPALQQGVMHKLGSYICQQDMTDMYVNFCIKAYSTCANPPYDFLTLEPSAGGMTVICYRNP